MRVRRNTTVLEQYAYDEPFTAFDVLERAIGSATIASRRVAYDVSAGKPFLSAIANTATFQLRLGFAMRVVSPEQNFDFGIAYVRPKDPRTPPGWLVSRLAHPGTFPVPPQAVALVRAGSPLALDGGGQGVLVDAGGSHAGAISFEHHGEGSIGLVYANTPVFHGREIISRNDWAPHIPAICGLLAVSQGVQMKTLQG
jgi:hypothetical protein